MEKLLRPTLSFKATGYNALPLFPDDTWKLIITLSDFPELPKLASVCTFFYYAARSYICVNPDQVVGFWGVQVEINDHTKFFSVGNLDYRNGIFLEALSVGKKTKKHEGLGCWLGNTIAINPYFYRNQPIWHLKNVALILADLRYDPKREFSSFYGVTHDVMPGIILGGRLSRKREEPIKKWNFIDTKHVYNIDTENAQSEMENAPFENGFSVNVMRKYLHDFSLEMRGKIFPSLQAILPGRWDAYLTLEKDEFVLHVSKLNFHDFSATAAIKSCTQNKTQYKTRGSAIVSVNDGGILGLSASFSIEVEENEKESEIQEQHLQKVATSVVKIEWAYPSVITSIGKLQPNLQSFKGTCIYRVGSPDANPICGTFVFKKSEIVESEFDVLI